MQMCACVLVFIATSDDICGGGYVEGGVQALHESCACTLGYGWECTQSDCVCTVGGREGLGLSLPLVKVLHARA
jgi:hypothetical protein